MLRAWDRASSIRRGCEPEDEETEESAASLIELREGEGWIREEAELSTAVSGALGLVEVLLKFEPSSMSVSRRALSSVSSQC